jgi:hypothetical protein
VTCREGPACGADGGTAMKHRLTDILVALGVIGAGVCIGLLFW